MGGKADTYTLTIKDDNLIIKGSDFTGLFKLPPGY